MRTEEFYNIFSIVYAQNPSAYAADLKNERYKTIRMLDSLGHCEFDFTRRKVYVCPPTLVGMPSIGLPRVLLTGARSSTLIQELKAAVKSTGGAAYIIMQQQTEPLLPTAFIIESSNQGAIAEIAKKTGIAYSPNIASWEIINFAAGLDQIALHFLERKPPNWQSQTFCPTLLKFMRQPASQDLDKLVGYKNPITQQYDHWLWRGTLAAEIDRDLGRYLMLVKHGISVLVHDRVHNYLLVPEQIPLPRLFARALALCSGKAPISQYLKEKTSFKRINEIPMQIYSKVPTEVVDILAKKLSQTPFVGEISSKQW